eukprot:786015-Amphidinium_carterae.1
MSGSAMVNSTAQFQPRLAALRLEGLADVLTSRGITTIGAMASVCAYMPGVSQSDEAWQTGLVEPVLRDREHKDAPRLRQ